MFEIIDGYDAIVTGILFSHPWAFRSEKLKTVARRKTSDAFDMLCRILAYLGISWGHFE